MHFVPCHAFQPLHHFHPATLCSRVLHFLNGIHLGIAMLIQCVILLSQLYGSTTVVMANYGLHWKWQSLTPCQRHPSEPIEKKFGAIDYVIDLNNLAKFGFRKIFGDGGAYTQHIRVCGFFFFIFFFKTFYALGHAHSLNGWTDLNAQYLKRRRLVRGGAFSMIEKNRSMTLTLKRSKSAILFRLQNFNRHYLENGTRYRESVNRS